MCDGCSVSHAGGELDRAITIGPDMLKLIKCTDLQQRDLLRGISGIPKCTKPSLMTLESQNIDEVFMAPDVETQRLDETDNMYTLQRAFYAGPEASKVDANRSYTMAGVMTPDPWLQYVTFMLTESDPLQDSVSGFVLDSKVVNQLKKFQPTEGQSIQDKLDVIYEDLTQNVTHILGRNDLLLAFDLVYHSVLGFDFQGVPITKGWTECLVIGDTRTGKSEAAYRMAKHYGLGELVVGENTSYAGLVGGMQQVQQRWIITWGKIPINNGRLVVIDEASGMSTGDISKMSGFRSSGIAEITKIQTERTSARTRLIWLSNPRNGLPLKTFGYGVEAVPELIGNSEDIARFDFIVTSASEEVSSEIINSLRPEKLPEHVYTDNLSRLLILWAWSRKSEHIEFTTEAVDTIMASAIAMGKQYSSKIPIVEAANQRMKLARLSVALAARLYSTDEKGQKVIVTKEHVKFIHKTLDEFYSKPSLDYANYSSREREDERIAQEHGDEIVTFLKGFVEVGDLFKRQSYTRARDLEEQLDMDGQVAKECLHLLSRTRMIDRTPNGYRKTPAFISILRGWHPTEEGRDS